MKVGFSETWEKIKGICMGKACMAMNRQDAEDLVSSFSVYVWEVTQGKQQFNEVSHAQAYFIRKFKFKIVDYLRYRARRNRLMEEYQSLHPRYTPHAIDGHMGIIDIRNTAQSISNTHGSIIGLLIRGMTYREIATELGMHFVTVGRYVGDVMIQMTRERRVVCEDGVTGRKTNRGGTNMEVLCQRKNNVVKVAVDGIVMARVVLGHDLTTIEQVEIRKNSPIKSTTVIENVKAFLGMNKQEKKEENMETVAKKAATKVTAVVKPAPSKLKKPIKPTNWDLVNELPVTLDGLQKLVGGEGYCLGGSGQPVARRFKPGYDAKLKAVLKKSGSKNAKTLAKLLGWYQIIKWDK